MENASPNASEVVEQLDRLVRHSFLRKSHRLVLFLRYVVEQTLQGQGDQLKERNVGTEVFGKGSRYDPAADSTVRVAASELRKRLALYYQEPEHERELRFSLPLGTYTPTFHWPSIENSSDAPAKTESLLATKPVPGADGLAPSRTHLFPWLWVGVPALVLAIIASIFLLQGRLLHDRNLDAFWGPLLHTKSPVLVLVANHKYSTIDIRDAQNPTQQMTLDMSNGHNLNTVTFDDMESLVIITSFLSAHHVPYEVQDENKATISDLRKGPVVLIGAYCNSWALRLLKPLKFHFANDPSMTNYWIEDSQSKSNPKWILDRRKQLVTNDYLDYAIVGRYNDNNLGQPVVIVSGIGGGDNINAAQALTDPDFLFRLFSSSGVARKDKNFEAVISAETVSGHSGQPRIEASYSW
ncbi:MAG: hypothetical protein P4L10_12600 [Acidobacteriaceae bacterium]|nr:hypothetical protein [Acidobacteriaceae bacterium]